ncbi:MAG: iron-siderophore ABC transporter permease, partial [Gammaproteobacteria bacterium]|nr:iron-siderophore ABC transporter permease [Gammaproteobacteria bacterium]
MLNSTAAKSIGLLLGALVALGAFFASVMLGTTDIPLSALYG